MEVFLLSLVLVDQTTPSLSVFWIISTPIFLIFKVDLAHPHRKLVKPD